MSITQVDPNAACYSVVVEKDVFVRMRDGIHIAVDVYRPDAPGIFPSLYAVSPYQKDLAYLRTDTIYHDARHPSHVLLPVIPKTARADSE